MLEFTINEKLLRNLNKNIERIANVDRGASKEIRAQARKIARETYIATLKSTIRDYDRTIFVIRKKSTDKTIRPGTLRRSLGTWTPKGARAHIAAGPRAGQFRNLPEDRDGWFAHFVEYANRPEEFGRGERTANYGVFRDAMKSTENVMRRRMIIVMQGIIKKQIK